MAELFTINQSMNFSYNFMVYVERESKQRGLTIRACHVAMVGGYSETETVNLLPKSNVGRNENSLNIVETLLVRT